MRRPWPTAVEDAAAEQEAAAAVIDLRGSAFKSRAAAWAQIGRYAAMVVISVGLVAIAAYTFGEWGDRVAATTPTVAAVSPTPAPVTVTTRPQPAVSVAATKATAPATTSTSPPTTLYVQPFGEAIPINDLRMTIYGIGDLRIGDPADEVTGALAATFGQPDAEAPVEPSLAHPGACPGSASRMLRWGILEITLNDGVFSGYRLDASLGDPDSATTDLRTVSGLKVGATVSTLKTIYRGSYAIVVRDAPERGPSFSLQRYSGEELFWGPVTSVDNGGKVLGIYSPTNCG